MTRAKRMTDERAERVLLEVMQLALTVREEGPDAVAKQLRAVNRVACGDLEAALVVAAALVDPERPVQRWWQRVIPPRPVAAPVVRPVRQLRPCGTHAAFVRYRTRNEPPDEACRVAERAYQRARGSRSGRRAGAA